jgi:CBS domain-containing protein
MTEAPAPQSAETTVADVMRPALTTVEQNAHVAAAAYLMKRAGATALVVLDDDVSRQPIGIITETDIVALVADGKDVNDIRVRDLMTSRPTTCYGSTTIRRAAESMSAGRFRHLPVVDDDGLIGIIDISDVSRALLGPSA